MGEIISVSVQTSFNILQGDGVTTVFGYTFQLPTGSIGADIFVYIVNAAGTATLITSNYTLNVALSQVTYPNSGSPLPAGQKIAILRIENLVQSLNFITQSGFPALAVMAGFDYLTFISQQLQEQLNRCYQVPIGSTPVQATIQTVIQNVTSSYPQGTYAQLKAQAALAPSVPFIALASDLGAVGEWTLVFYCGDPNVEDAGFVQP